MIFSTNFIARAITSAILVLAFARAKSETLEQPIQISERVGSYPEMDEFMAAKLIAPAENWRIRALQNLAQNPGSSNDFELLENTISKKVGSRDLGQEYLDALSDTRLKLLFDESRQSKIKSDNALGIRMRIVKTILNRPSLATFYPEADYDRVILEFWNSRSPAQAVEIFDSLRASNGEYFEKVQSARRAISNPESLYDFEVGSELLEETLKYGPRIQAFWLSSSVLAQLQQHGPTRFDPNNYQGSTVPIIHSARVCFEMARLQEAEQIAEYASNNSEIDLESLIKLRYWVGMTCHNAGFFSKSLPYFQANVETHSLSDFAAYSSYRIGHTYMMKKDWIRAVAVFEVTIEDYDVPIADEESEKAKTFLFDSGLVDRAKYNSQALSLKSQKRSDPEVSVGGGL